MEMNGDQLPVGEDMLDVQSLVGDVLREARMASVKAPVPAGTSGL